MLCYCVNPTKKCHLMEHSWTDLVCSLGLLCSRCISTFFGFVHNLSQYKKHHIHSGIRRKAAELYTTIEKQQQTTFVYRIATSKMKLTAGFLLLASLAASTSADNDWNNAVKCAQKNPDINTAIDKFCSKGNIMVPSKYARLGKGHNGVHVKVYGKCSPAQWIPPNFCRSQFHAVCARHKGGKGKKAFGRGGCQHFKIGGKKKHKPLPNPMGEVSDSIP